MEFVIGIILVLTFFALAYYCVKGHNLMIGFLIISITWTALSLLGTVMASPEFIAENPILQFGGDSGTTLVSILNKIYQSAPEGWGTTLVNVCWGAWFGRVLMETGIASTLIRKTVELGGDRPIITIVLLNVVTAFIFTAMMGAGPVIAIGVIVLPILMSLGIPKAIAMFTFMGSVSAGMYLNPVLQFSQLRAFICASDEMPEFTFSWYTSHWGIYALIISVVVVSVLTGIYLKLGKKSHAWAAQAAPKNVQTDAPLIALILPIVPVVLKIWLDFSVIGGFVIAGFAALFLCGKMNKSFKENCQLVNKLYYDGVVDTAPLVGFLLTLPMFNTCASYASPYFKEVLGGIMPTNEYVVCALFAALSILGFFRGPLTLYGCGAATLGVLSSVGHFSVPFTKVESRDYLKLSIPFAYICSILLYILTAFTVTGLGPEWFLS